VGADSVKGRTTRSQSVVSHADAVSLDNESTARSLKHDPDIPADEAAATSHNPPVPTTARRGRRPAASAQNKRKRESSHTEEPEESPKKAHEPRGIIASRHFAKATKVIMEVISNHKHASLFENPVKEKDAEGYSDIVRRPQNLKSIRAAISNGAKAVAAAAAAAAAAASSTENQGSASPGGGGGSLTLPASLDLMPPKAIVNTAQLERELMRMLANAVMFNTGEGGVVQDAREMFKSVQESVSNWRNVNDERTSDGRDKAGDENGADEETVPSHTSKRRKL
jgi:hypothetical protein